MFSSVLGKTGRASAPQLCKLNPNSPTPPTGNPRLGTDAGFGQKKNLHSLKGNRSKKFWGKLRTAISVFESKRLLRMSQQRMCREKMNLYVGNTRTKHQTGYHKEKVASVSCTNRVNYQTSFLRGPRLHTRQEWTSDLCLLMCSLILSKLPRKIQWCSALQLSAPLHEKTASSTVLFGNS